MNTSFRLGRLSDITVLIDIENQSFRTDRLSRASFRHFVRSDKSDLMVAIQQRKIVGYYLVLYRQGTALARLYSIATHPQARGRGVGRRLMENALEQASNRKKSYFRLEVRPDNKKALQLYKSLGFKKMAIKPHFYDDKTEAIVFDKRLIPRQLGVKFRVPYFPQGTNFTCGPASLLMAMAALSKRIKPNLKEELQIWRESTTIFMTSGHGGCGPQGLALAARRRGFHPEILLSQDTAQFIEGVRTKAKKDILRLVQEDFRLQVKSEKIPVRIGRLKIGDFEKLAKRGGVPIVLISSYKITGTKAPHWVALAGFDESYYYIHDPDLDTEAPKNAFEAAMSFPDMAYIPVKKAEFLNMAKFGKRRAQMVVAVFKK